MRVTDTESSIYRKEKIASQLVHESTFIVFSVTGPIPGTEATSVNMTNNIPQVCAGRRDK